MLRIISRSLQALDSEMERRNRLDTEATTRAQAAGRPRSSMRASVRHSAVRSSNKSRLVNFSKFHRNGDDSGERTGINKSGKVSRFSFWAMSVLMLARQRWINALCGSFFFAENPRKLGFEILQLEIDLEITSRPSDKIPQLGLKCNERNIQLRIIHLL